MSDEPVLYNMVLVSKGTPMNSIPESFEPGCCVVLGLHFCTRLWVGSFFGGEGGK